MLAAGFCSGAEVNDRSKYLFSYPDLIHVRRPKPHYLDTVSTRLLTKHQKPKKEKKQQQQKSATKCFFAAILWQDLIT